MLIEIKSGKIKGNPTLWSWHIWIVDKYPTVLDVASQGGDGPKTVQLMSHLLGAYERVQSQYSADAYREFGMQYQWGRKDPFPAHDVRVNKTFMTAVASYLISFGNREEMMWIMENRCSASERGCSYDETEYRTSKRYRLSSKFLAV